MNKHLLLMSGFPTISVEFEEAYVEVTFAILLAANPAAETKLFNFSFVANVTGDLLLVLLLIFIFGLLILYANENMLRYQKARGKSYAFKDGFSYLSGITFQRDLGGKVPNKVPQESCLYSLMLQWLSL